MKIIDGVEVQDGGFVLLENFLEDKNYGVTTIDELREDLFENQGLETEEEVKEAIQEIVNEFKQWCEKYKLIAYYGS